MSSSNDYLQVPGVFCQQIIRLNNTDVLQELTYTKKENLLTRNIQKFSILRSALPLFILLQVELHLFCKQSYQAVNMTLLSSNKHHRANANT